MNTAFLDAHIKDGGVVHAKPPPEWQPETLDPSKRTVMWKLQTSLCGLRSAPRRWQDHLNQILRKCGFVPNMPDTCLWTHTTMRVSLVLHVEPRPEVTTKSTRHLGRILVKTKDGYNCGVDASHVESMLEEFSMSALKSSPTLR